MMPLSREIAEEALLDARVFVVAIETHLRAAGYLDEAPAERLEGSLVTAGEMPPNEFAG